MVRITFVDQVQVTAESQVGNDIQRQHSEGGVSVDGLVAFRLVLEPSIEIGKMFLHHLTHSKEILLGEDVNEILACDGSGITGAAIGNAKHKLVTGELTVTLVEMGFDLLGAVDEFDVLDVGGNDEVGRDTDNRT